MECVICMGDISEVEKANTKCGHTFHTACLLENLATGPNGFKCPMCRTDMCSEPCKDIKEYSAHQLNYIDYLETEINCHEDWVLYFYDQADLHLVNYLELLAENKHLKKKTTNLTNNLKKSQANLSKTLVDLRSVTRSDKRIMKCSRCNFLGHNKKTCQVRPVEKIYVNPIIQASELRNEAELFRDLRSGELARIIEDHIASP